MQHFCLIKRSIRSVVKLTDRRAWVSTNDNFQGARFAGPDPCVAEQSDELRRGVSDFDRLDGTVRRLDESRLDEVLLGAGLDRQGREAARRAGRVGRLHDVVASVFFEHLGDRQRVQFTFRCDLVHVTTQLTVQ